MRKGDELGENMIDRGIGTYETRVRQLSFLFFPSIWKTQRHGPRGKGGSWRGVRARRDELWNEGKGNKSVVMVRMSDEEGSHSSRGFAYGEIMILKGNGEHGNVERMERERDENGLLGVVYLAEGHLRGRANRGKGGGVWCVFRPTVAVEGKQAVVEPGTASLSA